MRFLSNAVKQAFGPKTDVISALKKNMAVPLPERSHKTIHASDLTKEFFCPRQIALMDIHKQERKPTYFPLAMKLTFDVGEATADLFRTKWMVKQTIGDWECVRCKFKYHFTKKPADKSLEGCLLPGVAHEWRYREVRFHDPNYDYSGGLDCILDLGAPKLTIIELKIIAPEQFAQLNAPLPEHRIRTNLYMNLVEHSTHPERTKLNTKWAKVIYVSRGYGKKHESGEVIPFKEFDVERCDTDPDIAKAHDRALSVKLFRTKGILPARLCPVAQCPEAKTCQMREACFGTPEMSGTSENLPPCNPAD